jgi:hypothetical protein
MKQAGLINKNATTDRIIKAGFDAVAEYDQHGRLVGAQGGLSSQYAWERVAQMAFSRAGIETEEKATAIVLGDLFMAALDLDGGGTLFAIVERPVADVAAQQLTHTLDTAVGYYIGPVPAPLAVLGGVLIVAVIVLT